MKNILVVSGHIDLKSSVANKTILEELKKEFSNAEFNYLDELYPDFKIDVKKEQEKLLKADIIVLQFPVFWYSMPSLLERWMEESFVFGFSHGEGGDKLKGKKLIVSFTTGAPAEFYKKDGFLGHNPEEYFITLESMAKMTQMELLGYVYTTGVSYASHVDPTAMAEIKVKAKEQANKVINFIKNNQ